MVSSNHSRVARNCLSSSMILHPKLPLFHAIGVAHILRNQLGGGGFSNDYVCFWGGVGEGVFRLVST